MPRVEPLETGVYLITNTATGKVYVGSAAVSLEGRMAGHRRALAKGEHDNKYLQRSYDKHGPAAFRYDVLERCPPAQCVGREQHWLDRYDAANRSKGYNIAPTAGSMRGYRHTIGTKAKISSIVTGAMARPEVRQRLQDGQARRVANPALGPKIAAATKAAMARPDVRKRFLAGMVRRPRAKPKPPPKFKMPSRVSPEVVAEIRRLYRWRSSEYGTYGLARRFKLSQFAVMGIVSGRTYRSVPGDKLVQGELF